MIDGYVIRLESSEIKELEELTVLFNNNLNLIAGFMYASGELKRTDIAEISRQQGIIRDGMRKIIDVIMKAWQV